jgi:hypothetical protein
VIDLNKPHVCDYCKKTFVREQSLMAHMCEPKRRHVEKDLPHVKLALRAYQMWWLSLNPTKLIPPPVTQFQKSELYSAFVRVGAWSQEHQVQQFDAWVNWHIKNQTAVDAWCDTPSYLMYLKDLLLTESHEQAVDRSLKTITHWHQATGHAWQDVFRKCSPAQMCGWIQQGRVSAWVLYNAVSAVDFLNRCSPEQLQIIQSHAPMHLWKIRFLRMPTESQAVRHSLQLAGM